MAVNTIAGRFHERVAEHPDRVALRYKSGGRWHEVTWRGYGDAVRRAAKGLVALGLERGDKMSLLSGNRPMWHFADIACLTVGGTTVPVYTTSSPEQVAYIVGHSDSKIACVENPDQLQKVLKSRADLPALEKVIVLEGYEGDGNGGLTMSWEDLLAAGDGVPDARFEERSSGVGPDDLATFVYTSGTTGHPKAVMLTHGNIWWTCVHSEQQIPIANAQEARCLSYLPLSHIAERMISHLLQVYYGTQTWFAESIDTLMADLHDCRPTYFFGVPRVWEKFYAGIQEKMAEADPNDAKVKLARKAVELGRAVTQAEQEAVAAGGKMGDARVPLATRLQYATLDRLVLRKIRAALGLDHCNLALSAAAPINPELLWFFHSIGLKIAEGYGQSEDNGPTTWNPPDAIKIGTVGTPLPGVEVRIADDGEILARGGNVTPGYYKDDDATAGLIDEGGWMHSGDIGELDEHDYLRITDRKKDIIITAGGKNVAPQEIENRLKFHELVSQAVVIGDAKPFLSALITLDEEKLPAWAKQHGIQGDVAAAAGHGHTLEVIGAAVEEVNQTLAKVEGVKKFRVLERDFLQEEDEITPTLKVKRKRVTELYGEVIQEMYDKESPRAASARAPKRK